MYTLQTVMAQRLLDVFEGTQKAMLQVGRMAMDAHQPTIEVARDLYERALSELVELGKVSGAAQNLVPCFAEVK